MPSFRRVRGMRDFLPAEADNMKYVESTARKVARLYGYGEIITPILETYELLAAKAGEEIRHRMYSFKDLGGRKVALRPEFTPSVARLVATTMKNEPKPIRIFSIGSLYRYDEPQQGRFREFWQSNYELMGSDKPEADAEIILLTNNFMMSLGLKNLKLKVGHVGVVRGILSEVGVADLLQNRTMQLMDKKEYAQALTLLEESDVSERALETLRKLVKIRGEDQSEVLNKMEKNVEGYRKASEAVSNLQRILKLVSESVGRMNLEVDAAFARGLEYYTGMIFEIYVPKMDIALGGGGRYDKLIELFGGEPTPAVGVAHGIDRIVIAMAQQGASAKAEAGNKVMIVPVDDSLTSEALKIAQMLRGSDVRVEVEVMGRKVGKALEDADRRKVGYAIIVGQRELKDDAVVIRDLKRREQKSVKIDKIVEMMRR